MYGSSALVKTLMPHGLIDEYRFMIHPVVVGEGKRMFEERPSATLKLNDITTTTTGVVVATYSYE